MLKEIKQNILDLTEGFICHQVNCQGVMGAGIARDIKQKWPVVFKEYKWFLDKIENPLGSWSSTRITNELSVVNIYGQNFFGHIKRHTDYDAVDRAFGLFSIIANQRPEQVYVPYKMGCNNAGGDWKIYSQIIEKHLPEAIVCQND